MGICCGGCAQHTPLVPNDPLPYSLQSAPTILPASVFYMDAPASIHSVNQSIYLSINIFFLCNHAFTESPSYPSPCPLGMHRHQFIIIFLLFRSISYLIVCILFCVAAFPACSVNTVRATWLCPSPAFLTLLRAAEAPPSYTLYTTPSSPRTTAVGTPIY